jgi:YVTN family beta-propeller protein
MGVLVEREVVPVGPSPIQLCVADDGAAVVALAGGGASATVLDGETAAVRANVGVGASPWNAVSRGPLMYVAISDAVQVVDVQAGQVVATIELAKGSQPKLVVPGFDRERAYSLNYGDGTVSEIDSVTNAVLRSVEVGAGPHFAHRLNGTLYVANGLSNDVALLDETSFEVLQRIPVGPGPERCVFDLQRTEVWTNNMDDGTLSAIDLSTRSVVASVHVGPEPIRLTPWDSRRRDEWGILCRTSADRPEGSITFVDGATHAVVESLALPGRAVNWNWGIGPRHSVVYVALTGDPQLAIVDAINVEMVDQARLSVQPEAAGYGPGVVISKSGGVFVACQDTVAFLTIR